MKRYLFFTSLFFLCFSSGTVLHAQISLEPQTIVLFDGQTLDGWMQQQNNEAAFSAGEMADLFGLAARLLSGHDPLSRFITDGLPDSLIKGLQTPDSLKLRSLRSMLAREFNKLLPDSGLYRRDFFDGIDLRDKTLEMLRISPQGYARMKLNRLLIEDAYPEITKAVMPAWIVKDGAMASTGTGRGVIYTTTDYSHYRLIFTVRHVSGNPDHRAGILIFCERPGENEKPQDALGGIQFQVPYAGHWDYRPGKNNSGKDYFTRLVKPEVDEREWSRVEILVDASKGTARMAVAQPVDSPAVEVLRFEDPGAGKTGPVAWQMHNAGLFDEYKDVIIEVNPVRDELITVGESGE